MKIPYLIYLLSPMVAGMVLVSCEASGDNPGREFAPNMYHSVPYEPLSQITNEEDEGNWVSTREDEKGEYYNSNPNNPYGMTMRQPVPNTVQRNSDGYLPYRLDSANWAGAVETQNPIEMSDQVLAEGGNLYLQYCSTCHGPDGEGDGKAGAVLGGVANLKGGAYLDLPEGHIFHVITHGKGRMRPHGSQISIERRWKIVHYVKQEIQKQ